MNSIWCLCVRVVLFGGGFSYMFACEWVSECVREWTLFFNCMWNGWSLHLALFHSWLNGSGGCEKRSNAYTENILCVTYILIVANHLCIMCVWTKLNCGVLYVFVKWSPNKTQIFSTQQRHSGFLSLSPTRSLPICLSFACSLSHNCAYLPGCSRSIKCVPSMFIVALQSLAFWQAHTYTYTRTRDASSASASYIFIYEE